MQIADLTQDNTLDDQSRNRYVAHSVAPHRQHDNKSDHNNKSCFQVICDRGVPKSF